MLCVIGLNHTTAPVHIREKINFSDNQLSAAYKQLLEIKSIRSALIISTCNRTEIYVSGNKDSANDITRWLCIFHNLSAHQIVKYLFNLTSDKAVYHLFEVACGLDSLVLGEPQILGQLKSAFALAIKHKALDSFLYKLLQHSFATAKRIRTKTKIGANPVSVAYAAVSLAKQIFGDLDQYTALMIGAGETVELAISHLQKNNIKNIIVANRTYERAQKIADKIAAKAIIIKSIPDYLPQADIIISSTASQLPLLGKGAVETALKSRKHKPFFMVDIAVPRDIEEQVGELDDVFLYTVDNLQDIIKENQKSRCIAAGEARILISEEADNFKKVHNSLNAAGLITNIRADFYQQAEELLTKTSKNLSDKEKKLLSRYNKTLVNKLLHKPTTNIKSLINDNKNFINVVEGIFKDHNLG
jgi:glutamyl-tRNA reductase